MTQGLPEEVWEKLTNYFSQQPEVVLAYLYGSQASGLTHNRSDLDVGVLFAPDVRPAEQMRLALRYGADLSLTLGVEADVRELNSAPVELQFQVIRPGRCLYARSEQERVSFEEHVMGEYQDLQPALQEYYAYLYRHIEEGRFVA